MKSVIKQLLALIPFFGFALYSYTQVDPNLVISTFQPYWQLQQQFWQIGYHQRVLSAE
jgi:hypothetical protein